MKIVGENLVYELSEPQAVSVVYANDPLLAEEYRRAAIQEIETVDRSVIRDVVEKDSSIIGFSRYNMSMKARRLRRATQGLLLKLEAEPLSSLDETEILYIANVLDIRNITELDASIELDSEFAPCIAASFVIDAVNSRNKNIMMRNSIDESLTVEPDKLSTDELNEKFKSEGHWLHDDPLYVFWRERKSQELLDADVGDAFALSRQFDFSLADACSAVLVRIRANNR